MDKVFGFFLLNLFIGGAFAACSCNVDAGKLTCQPGVIFEFPEDVFKVSSG
jgi:hypothetical protein